MNPPPTSGLGRAVSAREDLRCPLPRLAGAEDVLSADMCNALEGSGCLLAASMHERIEFETMLAELSATFVHLPASAVDAQIESALRRLVEFLGLDRGSLAELLMEEKQLVITHSYHRPGVPPNPRIILDEQLPWYTRTIHQGEPLRLVTLPDDLPAEAILEREYCSQVGMKSHVMIPMRVMGDVVGAIGFASFRGPHPWPDNLIQRLRLVGEIFTNALARKRGAIALQMAEDQSRELRNELAHATRLELISHLTMSIAHEVNQPLCAISSNAQSALELLRVGELEETKQALQDIWSDARRGSEVVGRIRTMVKKEDATRSPTNLASLVEEIVPLLRREATARGVLLQIDCPAADFMVLGDRVQLQQVLFNLVLNAFDAVGQASVGPPEVAIRVAKDHQKAALVTVQDSGTGLTAEDCEQVFTPFFTTKAKGLGMGLAICRSIVQSHGGSIWASPGVGHGSIFQFRLPAASEKRP